MNCPTCGATLTEGTTTCPTCGAAISQPADFNQMQYQQPETNFNQAQYQQPQANYNQMPYANSAAYAPAGAKYKRKFNAGHFAVMGGSLLCLISVFLPFLSVSLFGYSESMSLFKDGEDGVIFLITAIVIIALSMLRVNTLNIILTLIQGIFAIYETMSAKKRTFRLWFYGSIWCWFLSAFDRWYRCICRCHYRLGSSYQCKESI